MVLSRSYSATLTIADAGLSAPSALRSGDDVTSTRITHCEHRRQFAETGSVGRSGFRFARRPIRIAGVISLHHPKPIHRHSGLSLFRTISDTYSDGWGKPGAPDRQKTERPPQWRKTFAPIGTTSMLRRSPMRFAFILLVLLTVGGCSSQQAFDASKLRMSVDGTQTYKEAKVGVAQSF